MSDLTEGLLRDGARRAPPASTPAARAARLCDATPGARPRLALERGNIAGKARLYARDLFTTLVNAKMYVFLAAFVFCYIAMYGAYAVWYYLQPRGCISNVHTLPHAFWFSVHTSATIGYGHMAPNADCGLLNAGIVAQVLTTLLMQASLLGLVFARFSSPAARAGTVRFSSVLAHYRGADGVPRLAFRVGNLRKHQILQPQVRMLLLARLGEAERSPRGLPGAAPPGQQGADAQQQQQQQQQGDYRYRELALRHIGGGAALWLGLPSVMAHALDEASPLAGLAPGALEAADAEIVVLLDGIDESTGAPLQARHSYRGADVAWGRRFAGVVSRGADGALRADFGGFDATRPDGAAAPRV